MIIVISLHVLARSSVERYQHFGEACCLHVQGSRTTGSLSSFTLFPLARSQPLSSSSLPHIASMYYFRRTAYSDSLKIEAEVPPKQQLSNLHSIVTQKTAI